MTTTGGVALLSPQDWTVATQWIAGTGNGLVFTDTQSNIEVAFHNVQVRQTDSNTNGLPDWWEIEHFGGLTNILATGDEDGDGLDNLEEVYYGYDPQKSERDLYHSIFYLVGANTNDPAGDDDGTELFDFHGGGRPLSLASNATDEDFVWIDGSVYDDPHSGGIFFNNDTTNLYIGVEGLHVGGNNVLAMFIDSESGGVTNLRHLSTSVRPYGFSRSTNINFLATQFTPNVGLLLGHHAVDGKNDPNHNQGGGNDIGMGAYNLSDNSNFSGFNTTGGSPISQWGTNDLDGVSPHDGVEVALSLSALNASPGDTIKVIAVFLGGGDGSHPNGRFVAGEAYGQSISASGFNSLTLVGAEGQLSGAAQTLPPNSYPGFTDDDVMFQAFFWNSGSPGETNVLPGDNEWYDTIVSNVTDLATSGFTMVYLPVPTKGNSGGFSMGYDPFDHYDVGEYFQRETTETRFGNSNELANLTATLLATNILPIVDTVLNHMAGDPNRVFDYPHNTFEKNTNNFHPTLFGHNDELPPYHNNNPFGNNPVDVAHLYPSNRIGLKVWGAWLTVSMNYRGYRLDFTEGVEPWFVWEWLNYPGIRGNFACMEYWRESSGKKMLEWLNLTGQSAAIWDWNLRDMLADMCDTTNFDISRLNKPSLLGLDPEHTIVYAENHDTYAPTKDFPENERGITTNKPMAYAYSLFHEGLPCVYWHDYYDKPYHDGRTNQPWLGYSGQPLKLEIDRLIWIRQNFLAGPSTYLVTNETTDADLYVAQRPGNDTKSGAIFALNDHPTMTIGNWVQTKWTNVVLRDWVPTSAYVTVTTDTNGFAWIGATSRSYRVYAPTNAP